MGSAVSTSGLVLDLSGSGLSHLLSDFFFFFFLTTEPLPLELPFPLLDFLVDLDEHLSMLLHVV